MKLPVIDVKNVSKTFSIPTARRDTFREHLLDFFRPQHFRRIKVLDNISFSLNCGESIGIMGRNGSGKSTLLKIITGVYLPDSGSVIRRMAITPLLELGSGMNLELSARDNIYLLGTVMGTTLKELRRTINEILDFADLEDFSELPLKHYSTGMTARLAHSVAFHSVRDVLILDEVLAVGDAQFRERCYQRYRQLHASGHTVILVSHNPSEIASNCQRGLLLESGKIVSVGSGDEIATRYEQLLV